jgi:acyl-coenzyme A synthetase/AMP-(fatty) acid ligase
LYCYSAAARYFLSLTSPTIIFADSTTATSLREAAEELGINIKIVALDKLNGYDSFDDILKDHDDCEVAEFKCTAISKPNDVALIVASSGTTGMPKATEISHSSLYNCLHPERIAEMEGHICTWVISLRWQYGVQMAFQAILACSTRIIVPSYNDYESVYEYIEKYKVKLL